MSYCYCEVICQTSRNAVEKYVSIFKKFPHLRRLHTAGIGCQAEEEIICWPFPEHIEV